MGVAGLQGQVIGKHIARCQHLCAVHQGLPSGVRRQWNVEQREGVRLKIDADDRLRGVVHRVNLVGAEGRER